MQLSDVLSPLTLAFYLIAINFIAFATFGLDKMLAEGGRRRIREATLLQFALLGGSPGAYAGRRAFRHKTRKQPFSNSLHRIAILQLAVGVFLLVFLWR